MNPQIKLIDFQTILPIWQNELWPNRTSKIESHSAMMYKSNIYNADNLNLPSWYVGIYLDKSLIGVNSGHVCVDKSARSRGLYVQKEYRQLGLGQKLLSATIDLSKTYKPIFIWSYPRKTSWKTYQHVGFSLSSDWVIGENNIENAYAILNFN